MRAVVDLADIAPDRCVLEVGAGTGSLTEELLQRAGRVVAVEVDGALAELLGRRYAEAETLRVLRTDALAGKHAIAPEVLAATAPQADLVANLPYHIATPLVAECLCSSWRSLQAEAVRFGRLTFTVQSEVADRLAARSGADYGSVSVLVGLLGEVRLGASLPPGAFWPAPRVSSRLVRIDFDAGRAGELKNLDTLQAVLRLAFTQRRKHVGKVVRARGCRIDPDRWAEALAASGVAPTARADEIPPEAWRTMANTIAD